MSEESQQLRQEWPDDDYPDVSGGGVPYPDESLADVIPDDWCGEAMA